MPGIKIGDGAIIAANSVVTKNVGAYEIHGCNPSQKIRDRFLQNIVEKLLELSWWNWEVAKITRNLKAITEADIFSLEKAI